VKEENPDGVIYFVNQKKGSHSLVLKKNHGISPGVVTLGFMSSPYDETFLKLSCVIFF